MQEDGFTALIGLPNEVPEEIVVLDNVLPGATFIQEFDVPWKVRLDERGRYYNDGHGMIVATDINVDISANLDRAGVSNGEGNFYIKSDDISCTIDIKYLLNNASIDSGLEYFPHNFMINSGENFCNEGKNSFPILIGANIYNKCYLTNVSYSIRPFEPVEFTASFKCRLPPSSGAKLEALYISQNNINSLNKILDYDSFADSTFCELSGFEYNNINTESISEIRYSRNYNYGDTSCLGEGKSGESTINTIDHELTIAGTGLNYFALDEGRQLSGSLGVLFKNKKGDRINTKVSKPDQETYYIDESFFMGIGSSVKVSSFKVGKGLDSSITIQEPLK